jgi:GAF domain-containing protein
VEPIPESVEALNELDAFVADGDLLARLRSVAERVQTVVPDCVGMSVAQLEDGVVFTLVASPSEVAALDAIQYLVSGPAVDTGSDAGTDGGEPGQARDDLFDEPAWRQVAQTAASSGIASTLTIPLMSGSTVTGSVNLYGASGEAFTGHHEELAEIVGGWAGGAVTNADLSFRTREEAEQAPQRLREQNVVDAAVGLLAAKYGLTVDEAQHRLSEAAERAGIPEANMAAAILDAHRGRGPRP